MKETPNTAKEHKEIPAGTFNMRIGGTTYVEAVRREQQEQKEAPKPEKKSSVLAKLQAPVSEPKKTARSKSAEREI